MKKIILVGIMVLLLGAVPVYAADHIKPDPLEQLKNTDPQAYQDIMSLQSQIMENPDGIFQLLESEEIQDKIASLLQNQNVRNQIYILIQNEDIQNQINSLMENPEVQNQIDLLMEDERINSAINEIINNIT